jgi:spermidine synthase
MTTAAAPVARPRLTRGLLLFGALAAAACGFVYELVIIALGTYLLGSSVTRVSLVLAVFVAAMGIGSLAARPLLARPVAGRVAVECAVALIGGLSAMALYGAFAWLDLYEPVMIAVAAATGALVGVELPLLITLMQRVRREAAGVSTSHLLAADYLGAVVAGVGFPFLLLPLLGQIQTAIAVGVLNALVGLMVLVLFARTLRAGRRLALGALIAGVLTLLAAAGALSTRFEASARQALYEDPIVHAEDTAYQSLVLTRSLGGRDLRLFLNGDLQFSAVDEYRYHEALVHPALAGRREAVLVIGGGDGLALREVLRYPDVARAVLVELDPRVLALARDDPEVAALNRHSLDDPRVRAVVADAFAWLRRPRERFDAIVVDPPDPDDASTARLYSVEFYSLARRALAPGGRIAVQGGSPAFAPDAFWSIERSMRQAGLATRPYHVDVPSFGDWGFHLGAERRPPALALDPPAALRSLNAATLAAAAVFPPDRGRRAVSASTLNRPRILDYERRGWQDD